MNASLANRPRYSMESSIVRTIMCMALSVLGLCTLLPRYSRAADTPAGFALWQLPEQTHSQAMSYVVRTPHGSILVIDGGTAGDAPYLRGFLAALGNKVDMWFVTHQHSDHFQALGELLKCPGGLRIHAIYGSLLPQDWIDRNGSAEEAADNRAFVKALEDADTTVTDVAPGTTLTLDQVRVEVLAGRNPDLTRNAVNNQCVVLRISDTTKSVLFLADLGSEGGDRLLRGPYAGSLAADYVQMAHHGQSGVDEEFYRAIGAKACLWPTPRWLWDNDSGKGKGTGPWKTLEVRAWMERLGIRQHFLSADGLHRID